MRRIVGDVRRLVPEAVEPLGGWYVDLAEAQGSRAEWVMMCWRMRARPSDARSEQRKTAPAGVMAALVNTLGA